MTERELSDENTEEFTNDIEINENDENGIVTNNNMNSKVNKKLGALPENLRLNGMTPSGKPRLFVCSICTRAFARQEHLTRHERSHTKEKPYCCGLCQRKFSRRDLLLRHAHKIHGGNYGDSIIITSYGTISTNNSNNIILNNGTGSQNIDNRSDDRCFKSSINNINNGRRRSRNSLSLNLTKNRSMKRLSNKRRASFSAQSAEKYAVPLISEANNHKFDRIKFSTPELLPIDYFTSAASNGGIEGLNIGGSNSSANTGNNNNNDNNTPANFHDYIPTIDINVPAVDIPTNEFNLLDTIQWINGAYNNNSYSYSSGSNSTSPLTGNMDIHSNKQNNISSMLDHGNNGNSSSNTINFKNTITSNYNGSVTGNNNSTRSSSYNSTDAINTNSSNAFFNIKDEGKNMLHGNNGNTNNRGYRLPSTASLFPSNSNKTKNLSPTNNNLDSTNTISEGLSNVNLNEDYFDVNNFSNFTKDVQSIFGKYIQDEEDELFPNNEINDNIHSNNYISNPSNAEPNFPALNDNYTFYGLDHLTISNISRATPPNSNDKVNISKLKPVKLFTPELRQMCITSLNYYNEYCNNNEGNNLNINPLLVSKELILPSCNELNNYLSYFQEFFLPHNSFIHSDLLNLDLALLRKYVHETIDSDPNIDATLYDQEDYNLQFSNISCLPLFMATCGSFYKPGCNPKTIELYEISRRVLHVYLETRKNLQRNKEFISELKNRNNNIKKPRNLWLLQSLILSVIFALFADYLKKNDSDMIKRQISAVCSIIKNSIIPTISNPNSDIKHIFQFDNHFEYIIFESSIRSTLMVYNFCRFLKGFYHMDSIMFLNESDIENICIPDDEVAWISTSLYINDSSEVYTKQNSINFQKFYHSFAFNKIGIYSLPEVIVSSLLFYEFNASSFSTFHVFLNRIDTKKLENNLPQHNHHVLNELDEDTFTKAEKHSSALNSDSIILKNSLMSVMFFNKIDILFCSKIWKGQMKDVFDIFLNSNNLNILTKGSYSLLTDFLVSLNFSIKNVTGLFLLNSNATVIDIDVSKISMFNMQSFYYNFLILIKFIMDFEATPNFKLLNIYTELKKLANKLLIPKFYKIYPDEYSRFDDIIATNTYLSLHQDPDIDHSYSNINANKLEKLINNVLIYSFNDTSFLNMTDQTTNEFLFNCNYPTYYPYNSSPPDLNINIQSEESQLQRFSSPEPQPTKSSVDLVASHQKHHNGKLDHVSNKQGFAERYQLSAKYVVISKCFFKYVREHNIHCHFLEKLTSDFASIEHYLDEGRNH